jgi:dihydrofolate synthase/folylpolyglutamate synthase
LPEYQKILNYLYDLQLFGIKTGLQNIEALLMYLGNPENHFPSIHIAGTNGKGSTASMIASILTASGYRTGLYTSPHLVDFAERIRIDGKKIPEEAIVQYTIHLKPVIDKNKATFFEATTAIAFQYFSDENVDVAVIETGLGGRLDATNVIAPLLSIITNIDIDHTEYLGKTYSSIAFEKGGIIKPFIPCLTAATDRGALNCLKRIAKSNRSKLIRVDQEASFDVQTKSLNGILGSLKTNHHRYDDLFVSLAGDHQASNTLLTVVAIEFIKEIECFSKITKKWIRKGLSSIQEYSGLRGRIDVLNRSPLIIADVAHNPAGVKALVNSLQNLLVAKSVLLFGVMKDKNYDEIIDLLVPITRLVIAVSPRTDRALDCKSIVKEFHKRSIIAIKEGSVGDGINVATRERRKNEPILAIGSHYLVGELFKILKIRN